MEELIQEWKESIIVSIHKEGDKMGCNSYRGTSLLSTSHNSPISLSNAL